MSSRSRGVWPNLRCKKRVGAQKNGEGNRYKSMEKRRNGDACKSARRGTGGEKRVRSPRQSRRYSQAQRIGRETAAGGGQRAEKSAFKGTFWKNGGGKEGFFRQMRTKGIKRAKNAQNRVERTMRESGGTGQRNKNFKRRKIEEASLFVAEEILLAMKSNARMILPKKLSFGRRALFFSKKVWTDRERDFFVREEKSGGAEKNRNLYLFPEEGGRSVQGGRRGDLSCFLKKTPLNAERGGAFFERFPAKKELAGGRKKKGRAFLKKARRTWGKNGSRKRGNFAFSKKEESVKFVNVC